ncbi:MAG: exopolyphosphatase [Deltaproteobacteria bacterium]|nr:exopolyphosphatase [Deltaproteobacteria bacterium]
MRLVTRSDFDGMVCAVLLKEIGLLDEYKFVHPKDVQDGLVVATNNDVLANIPYVAGCGLWFDHHSSEKERFGFDFEYQGLSKPAPSCARVIWEYYGGHKSFSEKLDPLLVAVDKSDSGNLTADEIINPKGWILLSFIMDPRTGLGRYKDYRVGNYRLMEDMISYCRTKSPEEILEIPDVKERVTRYFQQDKLFREMLQKNSKTYGNVLVLDLRDQEEIYTGNRFTVYTMFPQSNISIQVMWGFRRQNIVFACGYSIINRTSNTDVGSLMLKYGGGGHKQVGTCQVAPDDAERVLQELIDQMNADG